MLYPVRPFETVLERTHTQSTDGTSMYFLGIAGHSFCLLTLCLFLSFSCPPRVERVWSGKYHINSARHVFQPAPTAACMLCMRPDRHPCALGASDADSTAQGCQPGIRLSPKSVISHCFRPIGLDRGVSLRPKHSAFTRPQTLTTRCLTL